MNFQQFPVVSDIEIILFTNILNIILYHNGIRKRKSSNLCIFQHILQAAMHIFLPYYPVVNNIINQVWSSQPKKFCSCNKSKKAYIFKSKQMYHKYQILKQSPNDQFQPGVDSHLVLFGFDYGQNFAPTSSKTASCEQYYAYMLPALSETHCWKRGSPFY